MAKTDQSTGAPAPSSQPLLVNLSELAQLLGINRNTAAAWRKEGILPRPLVDTGSERVFWARAQIEDWCGGRIEGSA